MHALSDTQARTMNELFDRFEKEALPTLAERTQKDYGKHFLLLRQKFGMRVAAHITRADIQELLRVPQGARGTMHRIKTTSVLSSVFGRAMDWSWVTHNPCSGVRRNRIATEKRILTDQEFDGVRKLAQPRLRVAMDLVMFTRQPQGNLLKLRWKQVDDHVIRFRDPKIKTRARRKVEVEVTPEIRRVLDECRQLSKHSEYVISTSKAKGGTCYTGDGFRAMWQRLMRKWELTGNERFNFHHIRATADHRFADRQARTAEPTRAVTEYPQFDLSLREEANKMAEYYQVFYCLEQTIRRRIVKRLIDAEGLNWWDTQRVPAETKSAAVKLWQREVESGITPRSDNMIDYTSFGELSGIIATNWDLFVSAFHNKPAVQRVLAQLNLLRGPIAHSCEMTTDEIDRLDIAVRDWFRQVRE
jgi:integrase